MLNLRTTVLNLHFDTVKGMLPDTLESEKHQHRPVAVKRLVGIRQLSSIPSTRLCDFVTQGKTAPPPKNLVFWGEKAILTHLIVRLL